ncbi:MAG TPA: hypothetical protein PK867_06630, partial [Pirellulales bacterium]|nr:hypothetical protein [Pirellulales bacterium]
RFRNRSVKAVTFQGKLGRPIHRWYRLTASFSPQLADDIATHFRLGADDLVLDPFSGVGTVPLTLKYRSIPAFSVEINPYLHFVSTVKNRTYRDPEATAAYFASFVQRYRAHLDEVPADGEAAAYLSGNANFVPPIKNVERWWSPANLMQLVCLRRLLLDMKEESFDFDLLRMGVLAILIPVSNAKHNHVSLTFADQPMPRVDVCQVLSDKLGEMIADLRAVAGLPCAAVHVFRGNSKQLVEVIKGQQPTAVITSPPYPNRFSYARETRPHLFFMNFLSESRSVGALETEAIGGTWGKATSVRANGAEPANAFIAELLAPYRRSVPSNGSLMESYVIKYFNDMYQHASQVAAVCSGAARLAYVIGNSKFYGAPLPSDELLAQLFQHFGFQLDGIEKMRRRQSKSGLHEAVVFMSRASRT